MLEKTEEAIKYGESRDHMVHKTRKNTTQYALDTTMGKQSQIT